MYERHWGLIATGIVGLLIAAAIGWAAGRATAPESVAQAQGGKTGGGAIRLVAGIPVGVEHTRAGALAAADNYVAVSTETVVQDVKRYEELVRRVYAPSYQRTALAEAAKVRADAPQLVAAYRNGRQGVAVVAARRLDSFAENRATVMSWRAGAVWSADDKPFSQWFLTKTKLSWNGDRWLVESIDDATQPPPVPPIRYQDRASLQSDTFERELRGMTAPVYGTTR